MPRTEQQLSIPEREHREGCPARRLEQYEAKRDALSQKGPATFLITRCIDCGGRVAQEIGP